MYPAKETQPPSPMTSRELADAIDKLIICRIAQVQAEHLNWAQVYKANQEEGEMLVRQIADAIKRFDRNGGVYYGDEQPSPLT